jgi:hypothetical protein
MHFVTVRLRSRSGSRREGVRRPNTAARRAADGKYVRPSQRVVEGAFVNYARAIQAALVADGFGEAVELMQGTLGKELRQTAERANRRKGTLRV